jgi:hypothetical protein
VLDLMRHIRAAVLGGHFGRSKAEFLEHYVPANAPAGSRELLERRRKSRQST